MPEIILSEGTEGHGRVGSFGDAVDGITTVGEVQEQFRLTQQGEQRLVPATTQYEEIVRNGRAFYIRATTAVAAVVAKPTTAQMMSIYNDEPEGGRTYVIDWVSALNVAATAVVGQATIIVNNGMIRVAAPTDSGLLPKKTNGNGSVSNAVVRRQDTKALSIVTGSLNASQGIAHAWVQVGTGVKWDATATPGYCIYVPLDGRFLVPPGRMFATHVLANVTGSTFTMAIGWHEKQLVLG